MRLRRLAGLLVLVLGVMACSPGSGSGGELEGTTWVLRSYANGGTLEIVPDSLYADATFSRTRVEGFGGCNEYNGLARASGRQLRISQVATTFMACADLAMTFESTFLTVLHDSRFYGIRAGTLTIAGEDGQAILVFDAAPRNPLLGSWVVDSFASASAPGTTVEPISGTELTVVFGIANVGGSAGCNRFDGTYGSNGNVVRVGRLATTRLACADDVMAQEDAFLEALQGAAFVERRGDTLVLRDRKDEAVVSLSKPVAEAEASASPEPSAKATEKPTAEPTEKATPKPTATAGATEAPTPAPTPKPTAKPTAAPTPEPTPAPTLPPPASAPPTATCALTGASGAQLASIVYPQSWHTLTEPPDAACRYFDPNPISVPTEPGTVAAAVAVRPDVATYDDAVVAATDPTNWTVIQSVPVTVSGLPATRIEATSIAPESGTPVGTTLYSYIVDYGAAGTLSIQTSGTAGDPVYVANTLVVNLMAQASTFTPPND
jgi:heat shock protein HslJ